jgi:hypothetical protein
MNADASGPWGSLCALAAALTLATGCGNPRDGARLDPCANRGCPASACIPPFALFVRDETNQLVPSASATSPGLTCTGESFAGSVSCAAGTAEATYAVEVSAPGYVSKQLQVVVGPVPPVDQCGCQTTCQQWDPQSVTLAPAP